jgi:hypothetical protein
MALYVPSTEFFFIPSKKRVSYFKNFEHKVFAFQAKGSLFQEF